MPNVARTGRVLARKEVRMANKGQSPALKVNPFMPDSPVSTELFVGRQLEIEQIKRALYQSIHDRSENLLFVGDRGIGKSSLASFAEDIARNADILFNLPNVRFLSAFVSAGSCRDLDELCVSVIDRIYRKIREGSDPLSRAVSDLLAKIGGLSVDLLGLKLAVSGGPGRSEVIAPKFTSLLEALWDKIKDSYSALLIIIDETEHLARLRNAAAFMKSCLEQLNHDKYRRILFVVTVSPSALTDFTEDHPSFPRGFTHVDIPSLSEAESTELITRALSRAVPLAKARPDFLQWVYHYSTGIPSFIHELGRAAFDVDSDSVLDREDFRKGVLGTDAVKGALASLEDKHFRQRYTQKILSNEYRKILHTIASFDEDVVPVSEILKKYKGDEKKLRAYISIMVRRGVLEKVEGKLGQYRLPDRMFKVFLRLRVGPKKEQ